MGVSIAVVCLTLGIAAGTINSNRFARVRYEALKEAYSTQRDSLQSSNHQLDSLNKKLEARTVRLQDIQDSLKREVTKNKEALKVYKFWTGEALDVIKTIVGDDSYFAQEMQGELDIIDYD